MLKRNTGPETVMVVAPCHCCCVAYVGQCGICKGNCAGASRGSKVKYITNQLINDTHLAGDPKRKGCESLLGWGIINLNTEIAEIINIKVA